MKQFILLISCTLLAAALLAQKEESKDYVKIKAELNERIFGSADPFFKDNTIPDQYKNESVVILAQKHSLESDSKYKFRIGFFSHGGIKYNFFDIYRKKLLVNDQSALEEYSQLNFTKLQSKEWSPVGKLKNYTFVNIRLIKPGGAIKTIDVDESAVTIKDEKDQKKNKIAIPDLSVGDIIDYYVVNYYEESEGSGTASLTYVLGDDYPILNFVISLQLDARIATEYQCLNGAPDFVISPDADGGGNVLNMAVKNIPKIKGLQWSSAYRQLPIIRLNYKRGRIVHRDMPDIKEGEVLKATKKYPGMIESLMASLLNDICRQGELYKSERAEVKKAWKDYIATHPATDQPDSIATFVFRYINWSDYYNGFSLGTNYDNAYFPADLRTQLFRIVKFAFIMMLEFKIDLDFLVVCGKNSYKRDDLFSLGDLTILAGTRDGTPQYFSFADNFDYPNTVPYYLQGQEASVYLFDTKQIQGIRMSYIPLKESSSTVRLPSSNHKENHESDNVSVKIDAANPELLVLNRKLTAMGQFKKDEQAALTIYEEMAMQTGATVGVIDDIITQNSKRRKSAKKEEDELKSLLEKARTKHKEDFEKEIERNYGTKAKEVKSYRILNFGVYPDAPFEFEEEFVMEGWVKKAGNNYIVDIGKLIASQIEIKKDQRERGKDIYMPYPRSFSYQISFTIPDGYTVEGVEKLNTKTENETGAFIVTAQKEGNKLIVDISKYYINSFEPAANWPLMLNFLDKALEFNQQKILLKKI